MARRLVRDPSRELPDGVVALGTYLGTWWASYRASAGQLERVVEIANDEEEFCVKSDLDAFSAAERLYFAIEPNASGERQLARAFWGDMLEGHDANFRHYPEFVRAFLRAALAVDESLG